MDVFLVENVLPIKSTSVFQISIPEKWELARRLFQLLLKLLLKLFLMKI